MTPRTTIAAAAVLLAAVTLTGCGGDDKAAGTPSAAATTTDPNTGPYCALLKASAKDIASLTSASGNLDFSKFGALADDARKISATVPADIAPAWKTLADAVIGMDDALDDANTDLKAYVQAISTGGAPAGVTPDQVTTLNSKLAALQGPDIGTAAATIKAQAAKVCKVTLD